MTQCIKYTIAEQIQQFIVPLINNYIHSMVMYYLCASCHCIKLTEIREFDFLSSIFTWLSLFSSSSCLRSVSQRTNSQLSLSCSSRDWIPCGLSPDPTSSSPLPAWLRDSIVRTWDMTSLRKTFEKKEASKVKHLAWSYCQLKSNVFSGLSCVWQFRQRHTLLLQ